ncbi:hypothetical protein AZA_41676 [Nitrospirillum viridazoti Y2]|nr:hypothetical protein AZA_41676 [Nitrospirillum amazonense Y2]
MRRWSSKAWAWNGDIPARVVPGGVFCWKAGPSRHKMSFETARAVKVLTPALIGVQTAFSRHASPQGKGAGPLMGKVGGGG